VTTIIRFAIQATGGATFAPGAFDNQVGKTIPLTGMGPPGSTGKLLAADVQDEGASVLLTLECDDGAASSYGRFETSIYSFGFDPRKGVVATPVPAQDARLREQIGQFRFKTTESSAVPKDELWLIGSCGCLHAITEHGADGCRACPCDVPIERLAVRMKIDEEGE
jgi:hypothetical protein